VPSASKRRKPQTLPSALQRFTPQALVLDFDGVFTDNKVILSADGIESVVCDRSDGYAIQMLQRRGFPILVLSTEKVPIVKLRSQKLGLNCIHGVDEKAAILATWLAENDLDPKRVIYVGNDINDLTCMQMVGLPVAVADAFPEAKAAARAVLAARGGHGAIREVALAILSKLGAAR
jgi:YrbI family 3-deoxy-D-manno-octulosonate 8-phosphate phosphatase